MAEENPLIEIKVPPKPISNTRQQYLFENEKLILGRHGFIFRPYQNLKERLQENLKKQIELNKTLNTHSIRRNNSLGFIPNNNSYNKGLNKSKSELNILSQPILRFKNRTDLERICDTIQQYVKPSEQESLKQIRARHVKSIDFPTGIIYNGGFSGMKKLKSLSQNKKNNIFHSNSTFNISKLGPDKYFDINNKDFNINDNNRPKIYFTRLQRLNVEAKKIRSNLHLKTHFKGVESVFINPKQIYDIFKKDENLKQEKIGNYAYNENIEKKSIEERNEYKSDIKDLFKEEIEKQKIINKKEFSNYLNNKEYYNDRAIINNYNYKKENEEDKIKKKKNMNYLKRLAFVDNQNNSLNGSNESGNGNVNTDNTSNDGQKKIKKNAMFENENQITIGGKIYHMENQMDKIAKEILNKCKFYSTKK